MSYVDTNTAFQNNPNNAAVPAFDNMSDYMTWAKQLIAKGQAEGKDPTSIANGLKFVADLTKENIKNKLSMTNTPLQQTSGEVEVGKLGVAKDQEKRLAKAAEPEPLVTFGSANTSTPTGPTTSAAPFNVESFANSWSPVSSSAPRGQEVASSSQGPLSVGVGIGGQMGDKPSVSPLSFPIVDSIRDMAFSSWKPWSAPKYKG